MKQKLTTLFVVVLSVLIFGQINLFAQELTQNVQTAGVADKFTASWKATPSHSPMSGAVGMAKGEVSAWGDYGVIVNFMSDGTIKVRNGTAYEALAVVNYEADSTYVIAVTGDVVAQTYSVDVTTPDGITTTVATDYAFRTNTTQDTLNYFATKIDTFTAYGGVPGSSIDASYMDDPFVEDPYPGDGNSSYALNAANNTSIEAQTGIFTINYDVTPVGDSADCAVGLTQDASVVGGYGNYAAYVIFEKGGIIGVGKGGTSGWPAQDKPSFDIGTTYTVTLDVDVAAQTYTATVNGGALVDRVLITDHDFRDLTVTELNNLATQVAIGGAWGGKPGDVEISNIQIQTGPPVDDPLLDNKLISMAADKFTASWKATPSHAPMSGATGLAKGEVSGWGDYGIIVNFTNDGAGGAQIKARNGGSYEAVEVISYEADSTYTVKVTGDVAAQTYSVDIVSPDGTTQTLATDYAFRTTTPQDTLNFFATKVDTFVAWGGVHGSSLYATYMDDPFVEDPYPGDGNSSYALNVTNNTSIEAQTGIFTINYDVTPVGDSADCAVGLTQDASVVGGYGNYAAYVIFEKGGIIGVGKGGTSGWPAQDKPSFDIGTTYTVTLDVDVAAQTYTATVNGGDLTDRVLISNHDFRDLTATELNNLATQVAVGGAWGGKPGDIVISNISIGVQEDHDDWKEIAVTGDVKPAGRGYGEIAPLGNGKALIFGGNTARYSGNVDDNTWVYDTETDTWTDMAPTGDVPPLRGRHGMAYAGDDKAIVFGGQSDTSSSGFLGDTWIYDLSDNIWTKSSSAPETLYERMEAAMAYIGDDKVLLFGGNDDGGDINDTWVYDVSDDTWTELFSLGVADQPDAMIAGMAYAGDDKVLLYGKMAETWVYDLSDNTWTLMTTTNTPAVDGQAMAYLGDGNVLLYGGYDSGFARESKTWIYNVEANTWTEETPEATPPTGNMIVTLCETTMYGGSYLVSFGGRGIGGDAMDVTFEFGGADWALDNDPPIPEGDWVQKNPDPKPGPLSYHELAHIAEGKVLLFGGKDSTKWGSVTAPLTWLYDIDADTWTNVEPTGTPGPRYAFGLAYVGDDKVLMFGGSNGGNNMNDTWVYDLSDNTWTDMATADGPLPQWTHEMAYAGDDKVVMYGGLDDDGVWLPDTWVYDLSDNTWTLLDMSADNPSPDGIIYPAMSYFGDDKVIVTGGLKAGGAWSDLLAETWVFDVSDMAWTNTEATGGPAGGAEGMALGELVYLGNGVVMHQNGGVGIPGTWTYDGATNAWTNEVTVAPAANMSHAMAETNMAENGGGDVVYFGGLIGSDAQNDTWNYPRTEIVLPEGFWVQKNPDPKPGPLSYHELAHIAEGKVLLFGGKDSTKWGSVTAPLTWLYDIDADTWTNVEPTGTPGPRYAFGLAYVGDDKVLMFGGSNGGNNMNDTWVYDLSDNTWTDMATADGPLPQWTHEMAYAGDDKVVMYGGLDDDGVWLPDTWVYDLSDNTWTLLDMSADNPSPDGIIYPAMSYFGDDKVIVTGGLKAGGAWSDLLAETWVFDVSDMAWTNTEATGGPAGGAEGMALGELVYLGNGVVMHQNGGVGIPGTWTYDGATNAWTNEVTVAPAANMCYAMAETNMNVDGDGLVVYFGGLIGSDAQNDTWIHPRLKGTDAEEAETEIPTKFALEQNYPNPFNPSTTINYALPKASMVNITIYNVLGQKVAALVNTNQSAGQYSVIWNAGNVATGMYIYRIEAGDFVQSRKMLLMK
ncbi:MAG: kelch repeat-containing protein [Bacteroidota bacterium]